MVVVVGLAVILLCTVLQGIFVAGLLHVMNRIQSGGWLHYGFAQNALVLSLALMLMLVGNLVQACIWAWLFRAYGEFAGFDRAFYFSLVNFTTLGYGDIVLSAPHEVLGPLEAANGILMLGLTTSTLFAVLSVLLRGWSEERHLEWQRAPGPAEGPTPRQPDSSQPDFRRPTPRQ